MERDISRLNAAIEKVVISNSLKPDEVEGCGPTRVVRRADAHAEVVTLKRGPGRDILIFGSHLLWNDLLDGVEFNSGPSLAGEKRISLSAWSGIFQGSAKGRQSERGGNSSSPQMYFLS